MSQRPGIRNFPVPSTRIASGGRLTLGAIAAIRSAWISTVTPVRCVPVRTSITVTFVIAVDPADTSEADGFASGALPRTGPGIKAALIQAITLRAKGETTRPTISRVLIGAVVYKFDVF